MSVCIVSDLRRCAALSRHGLSLTLFILLSACGGGGGGGGGGGSPSEPTFVSVSTNNLNFSAASPSAPAPAPQVVTATVTGVMSGTLFIRIDIDGQVVTSATNVQIISQTMGEATFNPGTPASLGAGTHSSVIKISVCTTDVNCSGAQLAGSPKTINVSYNVGSSVQADTVAPYLGTTNVAGDVVLRGQGFRAATEVKFGATPAANLSILSDTEVHASYPALVAGNYAMTLNNGAIPFTASLRVVDPPAYASTTLAYPTAPQQMHGFTYDAERNALLVGVGFANTANNQILRYAFSNPSWSAPAAVTFANLRDIALSFDGSHLIAISDGSLSKFDSLTLATITTTPKPTSIFDPNEYLSGLAMANDGNAVVATGYKSGSGSSVLYLFSLAQSTFSTPSFAGILGGKFVYNPAMGASGNGATVALVEPLTPPQPVIRYTASSGILSLSNQLLMPYFIFAPAFDRTGSRMAVAEVMGSTPTFSVYDANSALLGLLPSTTAAYTVSPDGVRAYTMEVAGNNCVVHAFNLVATPGGSNALTELGGAYPISPVSCPASGFPLDVRMAVSPAGDTLFMAGNAQIVIVHLP